MSIKDELLFELEATRQNFHQLVDSVPETLYSRPSINLAWTIGNVLYHITLGQPALQFEIWMIRHAKGLFQLAMNDLTSSIFNWANARFARRGKHVTRQGLVKAYENGHAGILSSLKRMREEDFARSITYPESFVSELAGEVSIERLYHYVKGHFEIHAKQIRNALKEST